MGPYGITISISTSLTVMIRLHANIFYMSRATVLRKVAYRGLLNFILKKEKSLEI